MQRKSELIKFGEIVVSRDQVQLHVAVEDKEDDIGLKIFVLHPHNRPQLSLSFPQSLKVAIF